MAKVVMHCSNDSAGPLNTEDQLNSLRGQINEIKEHIELLMMQSAIIRERRSLLQHQQDIKPLEITEEPDSTCPETSSIDLLGIKSTQDSVVSGLSLALKGAANSSASQLHSEPIVTIPSDDIVVVQLPIQSQPPTQSQPPAQSQPSTQSQPPTSKLGATPRRYKPGRREFHGRSARHEPPALFQGWVDAIS